MLSFRSRSFKALALFGVVVPLENESFSKSRFSCRLQDFAVFSCVIIFSTLINITGSAAKKHPDSMSLITAGFEVGLVDFS